MGERTGSRVFQWVWSYVLNQRNKVEHNLLPNSSLYLGFSSLACDVSAP
ncbi:hypothetical protein CCHR01_16841 [Colletotrichum chrysophilum]|uniref:Uncharacterized protein n=1 Tax=Colletotrichum chrysophilum TaxID=1836956 RepID=A0AAD9A324_9PEZI|nr:hypothetical protein CCHR01_16841 [Colletotrichum chrysophilum]